MTWRSRLARLRGLAGPVLTGCVACLCLAGCFGVEEPPEQKLPELRIAVPGTLTYFDTAPLSDEIVLVYQQGERSVLAVTRPGSEIVPLDVDMTGRWLDDVSLRGDVLCVSDSEAGELLLFDIKGDELGRFEDTPVSRLSDDLSTILAYELADWTYVQLLDRSRGTLWWYPSELPSPSAAALAPSGACFAVGGGDRLIVYDRNGQELWAAPFWNPGDFHNRDAWFSIDSARLLVRDDQDLRLFDMEGKPLWGRRMREVVRYAVPSPGATQVVTTLEVLDGRCFEALDSRGTPVWRKLEPSATAAFIDPSPTWTGTDGYVLLESVNQKENQVCLRLCDCRGREVMSCRLEGSWYCGGFLRGGELLVLGARGSHELLIYRVPGESH